MSYSVPTPEQLAKITVAGLPVDSELRYYFDTTDPSYFIRRYPEYDLEWTRAQFDLMGWSYSSSAGPEYTETRVAEEESGDIADLPARLGELLTDADNNERAEGTLVEVTLTETALDRYIAERTTIQEVLAA